MRLTPSLMLMLALGAGSCERTPSPSPPPRQVPAEPEADADADAAGAGAAALAAKTPDELWALAPAGATLGVVVSARGVTMLESALNTTQGELLGQLPELAELLQKLPLDLPRGASTTLAELGLSHDRPAALFVVDQGKDQGKDPDVLAILPVADGRAFLARMKAEKAKGRDRLASLTCKQARGVYACVSAKPLLASLGKGALRAHLGFAGVRGEVEVIAAAGKGGAAPSSVTAAAVQLERGAATVRAAVRPLPEELRGMFGPPSTPRVEADRTAGFFAFDLRPALASAPAEPLVPGVTLAELVKTLDGPLTLTVPPGELMLDARQPLSDPAPFAKVLRQCGQLPGLGAIARADRDACILTIPYLTPALTLRLWLDGKTLRLGRSGPAPKGKGPGPVALTPFGAELAAGSWSAAFWGRGSLFGSLPRPKEDDPRQAAMQTALLGKALEALKLVSELGLAARLEGETLRFAATARTVFANPDDVVAKLVAIPAADILADQSSAAAAEIARRAPASPFAADHAAGSTGLLAPVGLLTAVAVPMMMDSMKRSKKSEAEIMLNKLGQAARIEFNTNMSFPVGQAPLTPAVSCCADNHNGKKKCAPQLARWATPVWRALDFQIDEPHYFQYSYKSDGKTFVATAVGDLDCDARTIKYELRGKVVNGNPEVELIPPAPNSD